MLNTFVTILVIKVHMNVGLVLRVCRWRYKWMFVFTWNDLRPRFLFGLENWNFFMLWMYVNL